MLYYKDNKFLKEDYIATVYLEKQESYIENENYKELNEEPIFKTRTVQEPSISWIHDKEWYEEIQKRVFNIDKENIQYEPIVFTEEQQLRLDEINQYGNIEEYHIGFVVDYVLNNVYPEFDNHPLTVFKMEKEIRELRSKLNN